MDKEKSLQIIPAVFWFTGLSCSGKTTIAKSLMSLFYKNFVEPVHLDGDAIRKQFNNFNFDEESRKKHNLEVGELASNLEKQGKIVIVSLISPYGDTRAIIRNRCINFIEVYIDTPLEVCIKRDYKGLYLKAISGSIKDFTGISSSYIPPKKPELTVFPEFMSVLECSTAIFDFYLKLTPTDI